MILHIKTKDCTTISPSFLIMYPVVDQDNVEYVGQPSPCNSMRAPQVAVLQGPDELRGPAGHHALLPLPLPRPARRRPHHRQGRKDHQAHQVGRKISKNGIGTNLTKFKCQILHLCQSDADPAHIQVGAPLRRTPESLHDSAPGKRF